MPLPLPFLFLPLVSSSPLLSFPPPLPLLTCWYLPLLPSSFSSLSPFPLFCFPSPVPPSPCLHTRVHLNVCCQEKQQTSHKVHPTRPHHYPSHFVFILKLTHVTVFFLVIIFIARALIVVIVVDNSRNLTQQLSVVGVVVSMQVHVDEVVREREEDHKVHPYVRFGEQEGK